MLFFKATMFACCVLNNSAKKTWDEKKYVLLHGQVFTNWLNDLVGVLCLDVAKRKIMEPSRGSKAT